MNKQKKSIEELHKLIIEARREREIEKYWEYEGDVYD
jgi:hypothetical protein